MVRSDLKVAYAVTTCMHINYKHQHIILCTVPTNLTICLINMATLTQTREKGEKGLAMGGAHVIVLQSFLHESHDTTTTIRDLHNFPPHYPRKA